MACLVLLFAVAACAPAPTPTPIPTATQVPAPTRTRAPVPTMTVSESMGIPACEGFTAYTKPFGFTWQGLEDVKDVNDWGYYGCSKGLAESASFYRENMVKPPYNWQEFNWVELPQGTLGVYFHAVYQEWLYLWFLPRPGASGSNMVSAVREIGEPLVLPCCR